MGLVETILIPMGVGVAVGIGALLFLKFRKPPKKEFLLTREKTFQKGEGAKIQYDVGLGGSPYDGKILELKENGDRANILLENEDGNSIELANLITSGPNKNIRLASSERELLHGEIKFLCNRDATGETKTMPNGYDWSAIQEKGESPIMINFLAKHRAYAEALEKIDDGYQYNALRRKYAYESAATEEAPEETEGGDIHG